MPLLDKEMILDFMTKRKDILYDQITRDFSGGPSDKLAQHNELKYWKEAIERGEFDKEESSLSKYYKPFETPEEAIEKMKTMSERQQMFTKEYLGTWVQPCRHESRAHVDKNYCTDCNEYVYGELEE